MGKTASGQHECRDSESGEVGDASDAQAIAARSRRFQALALPHLDAAYNLARWLSRNPGDAEDIVQDAFLRAFRFFDTFRGDEARPWLLAIVRRVWYDEWRRRGGAQEVAQFDELRDDVAPEGWDTGGVDPETLAIRAESSRHVHEALQRLPVEYREVLVLRELEELEYREIATVIDVPMGTVMSRLARARKRLAALLAAQGHGSGSSGSSGSAAGRNDGLAVGGSSSKAWRPSGRGPDGRFREGPAVDGGAHESRAQQRPVGPRTTEAPDEL